MTHELSAHPAAQEQDLQDLQEQVLQQENQRLQDAICSIMNLKAPPPRGARQHGDTPLDIPLDTPLDTPLETPLETPLDSARERKHLCDVCGNCFFNK